MITIKLYTSLEQSKKLAEFLSLESADGFYAANVIITEPFITYLNGERNIPGYKDAIPCWSPAALMDVLDSGALFKTPKGWAYQTYIEYKAITSDYYNNPIDACVAMIEKLHEQKLLRL